jgi:glycosyltransferase involved in cell wall biosynthesis
MTRSQARYRVTAIVANVKQFRSTFYPTLQQRLATRGIELTVVYSDPGDAERAKGDSIDVPPPLGHKVPRLYLARGRLLLQALPLTELAQSDLVILVQSTGYVLNYPLLALSRLGLKKVAFWGHGYNHQGDPASFSERLKRRLASWPDWWFAYTSRTTRYLVEQGMDPARITTIENAVDTRGFAADVQSVTPAEMEELRRKLRLGPGPLALYCGSLYREKRVPFLLDVAEQLRANVPGFQLLVVGAGSEAELVRAHAERTPAVSYAGPLFGREKAVCFRIAQLFLNPGVVGLSILDAFAAGLPFVTTADAAHGPEIEYLANDENGLLLPTDAHAFVEAVTGLLEEPGRLARLTRGSRLSSERYSLENMISNVERGIVQCLGLAP